MSPKVEEYRRKAEDAEKEAERIKDPALANACRDTARKSRELADQTERRSESFQKTVAVAVVDDDLSVRNAMQTLLNAHGFRTHGFSSARDFLHRDAGMRIDCVILDIHLGAECGIQLRRRLKADGCELPIIFVTGSSSSAVRQEAIESGCVDYLQKPVDARDLVGAVA